MSGSIPVNALAPGAAFQNQPNIAAPINPLAQAAQVQQFQQNQLAVQSSQQQLAARQAVGAAYQQATDPTTGATDYGKLQGIIASDPDAAWMAPQVTQQIQEQEKRAYDLQQQQLTQTTNRQGVFSGALAPLLAEGDSMKPADVIGTLTRLSAAGFPIDGAVKQFAATAPTDGPGLHQWALQTFGAGLPSAVQASTFLPQPKLADVGGTVQGYDANPVTNPNASSMVLGKTLDPGQQTAGQPGPVGPGGAPTRISTAAFAQSQGLGGLVPGRASALGTGRPGGLPPGLLNPNRPAPAAGGAGGGGDPNAGGAGAAPGFNNLLSSLSNGTSPGPADSSAPAGTSAGPQTSSTPAPMVTGLAPGQESAMKAAGTAAGTESGTEAASLTGPAAEIPQRKAMLSSMESDLANAPTGPGSQDQNFWSAFANKNFPAIASLIPGIKTPDQVASYENFEKMAGRYAQNQAMALGGVATGDKLSATAGSNPNVMFSTLGNTGVIHLLQGNEDALNVRNQAWNNYVSQGGDRSNFQGWSSNFNNSGFDPRVFWMKNMTPDERSKTLATFTPSQSSQFYSNMRTALGNGWVSPTDFGGAPAAGAAPSTADIAANPGGTGN